MAYGFHTDNATVSMVNLRMVIQDKASSDGRDLVADWHYDWPIDCSDHSDIAKSNALPGVPISNLQTMTVSEFPLSWGATTGVSLTGYTGLRAHVSGEQPSSSNFAQIYEFGNWDAMPEPRLAITYATPNSPPSASSASDSPDPVTAGGTTTFSVAWSDPNAGDSVRALICKTNSVTSAGGCANGAWAAGGYSTTSPSTAALTTSSSMIGTNSYYAFACDVSGACSNGLSGTFTVVAPNSAPVVTFNVTPTSGDRSTLFSANFNGTYDPNNDPISYRIDWGDGTINNSQNATHRYQNAGTYTVTGRACDGFGACSTSSRTVTVAFSNAPPTASLSVTPTTGDLRTTFSASVSGSDPDGDPVTYEIDWGDGATTSGSSGTHTYESPGRYIVAGIVTDSHGATGSDTREVVVCAIYEQGQCVERPPRQDPPSPNLPGEVTRPVADVIRGAPEPKDLAPSESNEVMILAANLRQSYAVNNDEPCGPNSEADCDSPGRLKRFVQRVVTLVAKSGGDGMGNVAPDVLLLQEVRLGQAASIALKLSRRLGPAYVAYAGAENPEIPDTQEVDEWCLQRHPTTFEECKELIKIKADSAIIYNDNVLNPIGTTHYDSKYDPDERCDLIAGQDVDEDDDGDPDCRWAKWKRQYLAGFDEHRVNRPGRLTGYSFAVASTHFVTASHFKDDDQKNESNVRHEEKKTQWTGEIADELSVDFPLLDSYLMGGDFNVHRCRNKPRLDPGDYPATATACETRGWWTGLTGRGFLDAILDRHINDDASRDRLREQYRDGKSVNTQTYRDKRIDYIFSSSATIRRASFDLTCGEGATGRQARHCRDFQNPEFYSDHRLLWTLVRDL